MSWSFRTKLTGMAFGLTVTAVCGSSAFFLHLYRSDKVATLFEQQNSEVRRAAAHFEELLALMDSVALDRVSVSKQVIFLVENPCVKGSKPQENMSDHFKRQFSNASLLPRAWVESLDVFRACQNMSLNKSESSWNVINSGPTLMIPYITVLKKNGLATRLAALSMDGFATSAANTLFLADTNGKLVWAADGNSYAEDAMKDTGVDSEKLKTIVAEALKTDDSQVIDTGADGLLSYARVPGDLVLISLAYQPTVFQPLYFAVTQSLLMIAGFALACLLIGKNMAVILIRPLEELRRYAIRLGGGDFSSPLEVTGTDEISAVKTAFKTMTTRILALLVETKTKTELESELQLAKEVQTLLLPKTQIEFKTVHVSSSVTSASQVGGDWWGILELPRVDAPSRTLVMIGDVSGHGAASALLTATARGGLSILSSWLESNPELASDPRNILTYFNRAVCDSSKGALHMTMFAAILDPLTGQMSCANAGHNLPYMLEDEPGSDLKVRPIGRNGVPLGIDIKSTYEILERYRWKPGYQLLLYTDGLTDCLRGDESLFDRRSLIRLLRTSGRLKGKELLRKILGERAKAAAGTPQADDITVVVCDARPLPRVAKVAKPPEFKHHSNEGSTHGPSS